MPMLLNRAKKDTYRAQIVQMLATDGYSLGPHPSPRMKGDIGHDFKANRNDYGEEQQVPM